MSFSKDVKPLALSATLRDLALLRVSGLDVASLLPPTSTTQTPSSDTVSEGTVARSYEFVEQARAAIKIYNRGDTEKVGGDVEAIRSRVEELSKDAHQQHASLAMEYIRFVESIQSTRLAAVTYLNPPEVGSATVLLYDHLITLDQEIDLVWKRDWSLLKGVFIFHRYLGNVRSGTWWFYFEFWGYTSIVLTSELVLLLWIFFLYNRRRDILAFLSVLFVAQAVSVVVILGKSFAQLSITAHIGHTRIAFCSLKHDTAFFSWYWLPVLLYNSAILALFIIKSTDAFRASYIPRVHGIYRRSLINFLAIFIVYLVCCILWIAGDFALGQIPVGFALAFSITSSTRLLINIRHAYYTREEVDLSRPIAPAIYANQAPREEWLFELRELRLK
ncbi:hypothetical protein B0H16DRAFT_1894305 [Mycena metata]|uniref:DUF6533 domain-containing protein n=1 Tax=Mycena metata TaxID=1033252 RepID=A0AAD7MQY0_9AGAR|nr:hypothetical protein B0H16DRAFT_1894305 [Mycena metata]